MCIEYMTRQEGRCEGLPMNEVLHRRSRELQEQGFSARMIADVMGGGVSTIWRAMKGGEQIAH